MKIDDSILIDSAVAVEESAEAILSVIGIMDALMRNKALKVTESELKQSYKVLKKVQAYIKQFCSSEPFESIKLEPINVEFLDIYNKLFEERDVDWLANAISAVPENLQPTLAMKVGELIEFLKSTSPRLSTSLSSSKARINEFEVSRFNSTLKVVEDPFSILKDLNMGCLSRGQVTTLAVAYPKFYELIKLTLQVEATNLTAKDPEFTLPWEKLKQASVLLLSATVAPDLQTLLQDNFQKQGEEEQINQRAALSMASMSETKNQRIEQK